ncbi:hypothetical protein JOF55_003698 [Haloactinomyces albus]|uniref:Uncharacterized protein n=1 Tax=Haloactinomyces albus TaxID=1352928 RepID=A0AAE3ZHW5_9ACTN|nr:hypothetical protein [Haloactinomyces albus]
MPRWAHNKMSVAVKKRYFELLRQGYKGAAAAREVGVSPSCGSLWFIDAGRMLVLEASACPSPPIDKHRPGNHHARVADRARRALRRFPTSPTLISYAAEELGATMAAGPSNS